VTSGFGINAVKVRDQISQRRRIACRKDRVLRAIRVGPIKCTKIAAKLIRTFTDRHGLKDLCKELLGVELSKQQQSSDWGAMELTSEQLAYAASDVLYLHALWAKLQAILIREDRLALAEACFAFLPTRGQLDLLGYEQPDIFAH
jgi:ribonuclease D